MAKQAKEKDEKPKLEIKTRTPKKSSGIFDNIGQNRGSGEHPLREILNAGFPAAGSDEADPRRPPIKSVDAHTPEDSTPTEFMRTPTDGAVDAGLHILRTPTEDSTRRPLSDFIDIHRDDIATPTASESGQPLSASADSQADRTWTPENESGGPQPSTKEGATSSVIQESNQPSAGSPPDQKVDSKAPEMPDQAPTVKIMVDTSESTVKKAGVHRSRDWNKVESARTTGRMNIRPSPELEKKFRIYCAANGMNLTEFFELAGLRMIEVDSQASGEVGALAPLDDRRLTIRYRTRVPIINLYLAYTARFNEHSANAVGKWSGKWIARDDEAGAEFNEIDIKIVELGIIQTQANKGIGNGKIQTFKYYIDEIRNVLQQNMADDTLKIMVTHQRGTLTRWFGRDLDLSFLETTDE